jgi:polysaccharide biosynthesis/export protein
MQDMAPLGLAQDAPPDMMLRPGDEVFVESAVGDEHRSLRARVDARGALHVGSQQDVKVAGLTLESAEARVASILRQRDRFVEVNLLVASRTSQRVVAFGALTRPGPVDVSSGMRVADVVAAAGGVLLRPAAAAQPALELGDLDRAALLREGTALPISLREALRGTPGHNVYVHPGDLLYVPFVSQNAVAVLGQVTAPGLFPHHSGMRLTEALGSAGGVTLDGDKGDIRVVRGPVHAPRAYTASLSAIADGKQHDSLLVSGDVVFVTDSFLEDLAEVMEVVTPFIMLGIIAGGVLLLTQ